MLYYHIWKLIIQTNVFSFSKFGILYIWRYLNMFELWGIWNSRHKNDMRTTCRLFFVVGVWQKSKNDDNWMGWSCSWVLCICNIVHRNEMDMIKTFNSVSIIIMWELASRSWNSSFFAYWHLICRQQTFVSIRIWDFHQMTNTGFFEQCGWNQHCKTRFHYTQSTPRLLDMGLNLARSGFSGWFGRKK